MKLKQCMSYVLITYLSIQIGALHAQETDADTGSVIYSNIKQVVLSANKSDEKVEDISSQINIIGKRNIATLMPQTMADALIQNGTVFVQKSQMGGGSPVIRGFEANKILLVVDGVRMNNAIYRGGHLQNVISVDPNALQRIEVFNGPGSVIYGSDALGGVIHMFTQKPILAQDSYFLKSNAFIRGSSANKENTFHVDFNYGRKKWASFTSFTSSNYGDLTMGKNNAFFRNDSNFGNKLIYASRLNGKDTALVNPNPREQLFTGYSQIDIVQKVLFQPKENISHLLNIQHSNTTDVPRYDRSTDIRNGKPRFAEWYYGPQVRTMLSYQLQLKNAKWYDNVSLTTAYQKIKESRYTREFDKNSRFANEENLNVFSANADLTKQFRNKHEVRYGGEYFYNTVGSVGYRTNILTNLDTADITRYPDGSKYTTAGLYLTDRWEIKENLILSIGGRFNYFSLASTFDSTFIKFNQLQVNQSSSSAIGHIGMVMKPLKKLRIIAQMSTGFRNPNVDDMSKTFENNNNAVVLPNPELRPEQVFSQEIGFDFFVDDKLWIDFRAYNTDFIDAMVVRNATFNGSDSNMFNGANLRVQKTVNVAQAFIRGFSSSINVKITESLKAKASLNYTYGRDKTDGLEVPLDHIPPIFASAFIDYHKKNWTTVASVVFNGKKDIKDYRLGTEDNERYAPSYGMPAWYTLNFKTSYQFDKGWIIRAGVENILNHNYRHFASGMSAAGRNFILSVGYTPKLFLQKNAYQ